MDKNLFSTYDIQFCECTIRRAFIKKVFALVTIMLTIVAVMCALPFIFPDLGTWLRGGENQDDTGAFIFDLVACFVFLGIAIAFACCQKLTRMVPYNLILLAIFTLSAGVMLMCMTAYFTFSSVLLSMCITAGSCAAIVVFAIFVNKDLTTMIGFMFLFGIWLLFFGITAAIAVAACGVEWMYTLYSALISIFFLIWLAIDIQLVMGGGRFEISPEEYVFAAMTIFLDIINIFIYILGIFGRVK